MCFLIPCLVSSFFHSLGTLTSLPYTFMSVVGTGVGDGAGGWRGVRPLPPVTWWSGLGWCALKR